MLNKNDQQSARQMKKESESSKTQLPDKKKNNAVAEFRI